MELRQIKELMTAMGRSGIKKIALKKEGFELQLEAEEHFLTNAEEETAEFSNEPFYRETSQKRKDSALARGQELSAPLAPPHTAAPMNLEKQHYVTSPMVGTYYSSASPDNPPFVKIGDKVDKNTIVCIIEAMKVMNEVKSTASGVVVEILVENGHPVEFGSKLYRIEQNN